MKHNLKIGRKTEIQIPGCRPQWGKITEVDEFAERVEVSTGRSRANLPWEDVLRVIDEKGFTLAPKNKQRKRFGSNH